MRFSIHGAGLVVMWIAATATADEPSLAVRARQTLQTHCGSCHGGGKAAKGGLGFISDRDRLVARGYIVPGRANDSDLHRRMAAGEMPPKSAKSRPSRDDLAVIAKWIDAGAPSVDTPLDAAPLSPYQAVAAIEADLAAIDARSRPFIRYFTLDHLSRAGRPESHVATHREAVGKLINSLSWHPRVTPPTLIDAGGTLLRIDLRAYRWTPAFWEKLTSRYPYDPVDAGLSRRGREPRGTRIAIRGDWFVAVASRPPLYHELLQLPTTDRGLERLLMVDAAGDIETDQVVRAGFNDSGVSKNNRLIERHDAAFGAFWRSYDFSSNAGRQNLFEHPLGPHAGSVSFQPAGGEMIFHLPNGLLAFMLVDGAGRRIDKGPTDIVADPRRPDQRVETGVSCMSCHARGLIFKADQIRGHVEKNADAFPPSVVAAVRATHVAAVRATHVAAVRATHVAGQRFQAFIDDDNARVTKALALFGVRDPDEEPINLVVQRFEATVDRIAAAAELGVDDATLETRLRRDPELARILGSLLTKGGVVQRSVFEEYFPALARRIVEGSAIPTTKVEPRLGSIRAIALSTDGRTAVTAGDDRKIRVWDMSTRRPLWEILDEANDAVAVALSPDRRLLASAGDDRVVRLYDVQVRKPLRVFKGHTGTVRGLAFSRDGRRLASGGDDRTIRVWNLDDDAETISTGHADGVLCLAWTPDDARLLAGGRDGAVFVWKLTGSAPPNRLEGHAGAILSLAISADGKQAITGGNDRTVRVWDLGKLTETHVLRNHATAVVAVRLLDGEAIGVGSQLRVAGGPVVVRCPLTGGEPRSMSHGEPFGAAAISPDGRRVVFGGLDGVVRSIDVGSR